MVEARLSSVIDQQLFYRRYVDDILVISRNQEAAFQLIDAFNSAHSHLKVTFEVESNDQLPFLDVLLRRTSTGKLETSVYRKGTWSGQYLHFHSFSPIEHKRAVVKTLITRAYRICSETTLEAELTTVKETLMLNGYPESFIKFHSKRVDPKPTVPSVPKKRVMISYPSKVTHSNKKQDVS